MSIDPLRTYRRRVTTTWIVGLPLLGVAAWWTLRTPRVVVVPPPAPAALEVDTLPSTSADQSPVASPAAMADAFVLKTWSPARDAEPVAARPTTPPRPVAPRIVASRLELLGIVQEGSTWKAAIYDPELDRVFVVGDGEQVGSRRVRRVTDSLVELTAGAGIERLEIRKTDDESAGAGT